MSNFIYNYFHKMRNSDEKTKHRSAMTMAIILSAITIMVLIYLFQDRIFNIDKSNSQNTNTKTSKIEEPISSKIESPLSSFLNFFKSSKGQFSNLKSDISSIYSSTTNQ